MKKLVFAALLLASVAGFAQEKQEKPEGGRPPREERLTPEEHTKRLTKDLKLDATQQEKVKAHFAEQEKKHAALKADGGKKPEKGKKPEPPKGDDPRKKSREETDAKMKEILNKDQYKQWQQLNKADAPAGKKRGEKSE